MVALPLQILISVSGLPVYLVDRLPSLFGVTKVSRKGIDPSALVVSAVNLSSLQWH